jgi:hypothetical protein
MRNAWEAARAAGVNLAFIGGNQAVWQARYGAGDQTLIEYRSANLDPDPVAAQKTVMFSQDPVNRPQCQLLGVGYPGGVASPGGPPLSYVVTASAASTGWLAGTNLSRGSTIYDSVGYEWDSVQPGCAVPPLTTLLHYSGPNGKHNADAVSYRAPSGAHVFSAGSLQLVWALDDFGHSPHVDPRVQQLFTNIFDTLAAPPPPGAPAGLPVLLASAEELVGRTAALRWSDPISGAHIYVVLVDGHAGTLVGGVSCGAGTCAATVRMRPGTRVVQLWGIDDLGNEVYGAPVRLIVDGVPPGPFALRGPKPAARVCTRRLRFSWSLSRDRLAGIAYYVLLIDGRPVARTRRASVTIRRRWRPGRHTWTVVAVDGVGNRRRARARALFSC